MKPPRPSGRGGTVYAAFPRLKSGAVLRLRTRTAFRQPADRCGVGHSGKVYEFDPGAFAFLRECDGRTPLATLRRRHAALFDASLPDARLAAELAADPTLSDLIEVQPRPAPSDPNQVVETAGLACACRIAVWQITSACDLSCRHCYLDARPTGKTFDRRTMLATVRNLHAIGVEGVRLSGGEPTLRPTLLESVCAALAEHCLPFSVNSNAAGDVSALARVFRRHPDLARFVQVSLDGPGSAHDAFRGQAGAYERSLANLRRLKAGGVPVCVVSMMHRGWLGQEARLAKDLASAGVDQWTVELPVAAGRWRSAAARHALDRQGIAAMSARLVQVTAGAFRVFEINQVFRRPAEAGEIQKTGTSPVCMHHLGLLTIDEKGLSFCSVFGDTFGPSLTAFAPSYGSRASFFRAWNRIARARISRRIADNPACRACKLLAECQGGCPGHYPKAAAFSGCDRHARLLTEVRLSLAKRLRSGS